MEQDTLTELKRLLDEVIFSHTKAAAKTPIRKLEFKSSMVKENISPYASEKLSQAIGYAKEASGQVDNKEHWKKQAEQAWYLFEREVSRNDN